MRIDRGLVGLGMLLAVLSTSGMVAWQERELARSSVVYLELGPADPRSLVQGDFMRLRYLLEEDLADLPAPGEVIVEVDGRGVAHFDRVHDGVVGPDERRLDYFSRNRRNTVAPRAFLFEEGTADLYAVARFGVLAVTPEGHSTLVGLADADLNRLGPAPRRF